MTDLKNNIPQKNETCRSGNDRADTWKHHYFTEPNTNKRSILPKIECQYAYDGFWKYKTPVPNRMTQAVTPSPAPVRNNSAYLRKRIKKHTLIVWTSIGIRQIPKAQSSNMKWDSHNQWSSCLQMRNLKLEILQDQTKKHRSSANMSVSIW